MTDLPDPSMPTTPPPTATPTGNKETVGGVDMPEVLRAAGGQEIALPKEVVSAGVRVQPTSIPIPAPVAQMGVAPAGKNIVPAQPVTMALPLTDDQIAQGLRQSITNSWLWLAHWCIKQLKKVGATIRVKI